MSESYLDLSLVRETGVNLVVLIAEPGSHGTVSGVLGAVVLLDVPALPPRAGVGRSGRGG